jgi:ABC-type antimicrobial peptide transport system permease subunit
MLPIDQVVIDAGLAQFGSELTLLAIRGSESPPPYWMTDQRIDGMSVLFATSVAVFAALIAGLWPAWRAAACAPLHSFPPAHVPPGW